MKLKFFNLIEQKKTDRPLLIHKLNFQNILTKLGEKHNLIDVFVEKTHLQLRIQVLGMQLYYLMLKDLEVFCKTTKPETYFTRYLFQIIDVGFISNLNRS